MNFFLPYVGILAGVATVSVLIWAGAHPLIALLAYPISGVTAILPVAIFQSYSLNKVGVRGAGRKSSPENSEGLAFHPVDSFRRH